MTGDPDRRFAFTTAVVIVSLYFSISKQGPNVRCDGKTFYISRNKRINSAHAPIETELGVDDFLSGSDDDDDDDSGDSKAKRAHVEGDVGPTAQVGDPVANGGYSDEDDSEFAASA